MHVHVAAVSPVKPIAAETDSMTEASDGTATSAASPETSTAKPDIKADAAMSAVTAVSAQTHQGHSIDNTEVTPSSAPARVAASDSLEGQGSENRVAEGDRGVAVGEDAGADNASSEVKKKKKKKRPKSAQTSSSSGSVPSNPVGDGAEGTTATSTSAQSSANDGENIINMNEYIITPIL